MRVSKFYPALRVLSLCLFFLSAITVNKLFSSPSVPGISQVAYHALVALLTFFSFLFGTVTVIDSVFLRKDFRLIVFLWPFIFLLPYISPIFHGQYFGIGNDFLHLYYRYKYYLLSGLTEGRMLLWSPSEAAGFPFYSSPFTQSFYPLNLLLVIYGRIFQEYTILDHQGFTVLGIAIFGLGLYNWLLQLPLRKRAVLFVSLLMPVSFKVVELLRFPNATHTAAWIPWILFGMTKVFQSQTGKQHLKYGAMLTFFAVCMLTGGYPYFVYYSVFLFIPYFFVFLVPRVQTRLIGIGELQKKQAVRTFVFSMGTALLLCLPYVGKMAQLLQQSTDRTGNNFEYSTQLGFNLMDTLGSLVYPPVASPEGWYFFSTMGVLLIGYFLLRKKQDGISLIEGEKGKQREILEPVRTEKLFFIFWIAIISYITYGRDSILFKFLWLYLPGFSSLRIWARMNIILVVIIAWLLAISYSSFESWLITTFQEKKTSFQWHGFQRLFLIYFVILEIQLFFWQRGVSQGYWQGFVSNSPVRLIQNPDISDEKFIIFGFISFFFITTCLVIIKYPMFHKQRFFSIVFLGITFLSLLEVRNAGPFFWTSGKVPVDAGPKGLLDLKNDDLSSFSYSRTLSFESIPLQKNFSAGVVDNWYFNRYLQFLFFARSEPDQRDRLLGVRGTQKIFFSESIQHDSIRTFLQDADRFPNVEKVLFYDGDILNLEVNAPARGFLSFIDNWDPDWYVYVDDQPEGIQLLFGTFKSVEISPGKHTVVFKYLPFKSILPEISFFGRPARFHPVSLR